MRRSLRATFTAMGRLLVTALTVSSLVPSLAIADPRTDYMLQCQGCHLPDGSGSPGSVPDLRGNLELFLDVRGGREFLIRVPGSAQSPLSNQRLAGVLNWMVREFGSSAGDFAFQVFTADEVGLNREPLADVDFARKELMERIESGQ